MAILQQGNNNLKYNLIAYWKLDGSSIDSINSFNGTDTDITYVAGKLNDCASFNGTTSKIEIPNVSVSGGNFTISFWIKPTSSLIGIKPLIASSTSSKNILFYNNLSQIYFDNAIVASGFSVRNIWYHVAVIVKNGIGQFYVNGVASGGTAAFTSTYTFTHIGYANFFNLYNDGELDEFGIWSRALSTDEITYLYNSGNAKSFDLFRKKIILHSNAPLYKPDATGMVLFLDADNTSSYPGTGNTWYDLSPEGNHCTLSATYPPVHNPSKGAFEFIATGQLSASVQDDATLNFGTGDFTIIHSSTWPIKQGIANCILFKGARFDGSRAGWLVTSGANGDANAATFNVVSDGLSRNEIIQGFNVYNYGIYGLMRRGGNLYNIINGVAILWGINSLNISSTDNISIGYNPIYGSWFTGTINSIMMWNRGITDNELANLVNYQSHKLLNN